MSTSKIEAFAQASLLCAKAGEVLVHHSGKRYYLIMVANSTHPLDDPRFPPTLVYRDVQDIDAPVYSRPVKDMLGKFVNINFSQQAYQDFLDSFSESDNV